MFPEQWSAEEKISTVVFFGGFISAVLSIWGAFKVVWLDSYMINSMSANLFVLAGIFGIPTLTFGVWMCWRGIGFPLLRWSSAVLGGIGVSIWPLMDYATGRAG